MADSWKETCLGNHATLREALTSLNRSALQICLIVSPAGELLGTLTDGDIRRALLRGASLDEEINPWVNFRPHVVRVNSPRESTLDIMRRLELNSLPMLDDLNRVTGLITINEAISAPILSTPVLIMAGGRGSRLLPLTEDIPKPLIRVAGEPLIDILLRRLRRQGFRRVWIATRYLAEILEKHIGDGSQFGIDEITFIRELEPLGTAGALAHLPQNLREPVLVTNADIMSNIDFGAIVKSHLGNGSHITVAVRKQTFEIPFGVIDQQNSVISAISEKPLHSFEVSTGINVVSALSRSLIVRGQRTDMNELITHAIARGQVVRSHESSDYWLDVGTKDSLVQAEQDHSPLCGD